MDTTVQYGDGCANSECEYPTSWDLCGIILDDEVCCSAECAREHIDATDSAPDTVTLHDPQHIADRSELPAVSDDDINITCAPTDRDDALAAVNELEKMFGAQFVV